MGDRIAKLTYRYRAHIYVKIDIPTPDLGVPHHLYHTDEYIFVYMYKYVDDGSWFDYNYGIIIVLRHLADGMIYNGVINLCTEEIIAVIGMNVN